jgi:hypothetical protein
MSFFVVQVDREEYIQEYSLFGSPRKCLSLSKSVFGSRVLVILSLKNKNCIYKLQKIPKTNLDILNHVTYKHAKF